MPRPSKLQIAKTEIFNQLSRSERTVYSRKDIGHLLDQHREYWKLAKRTTIDEFINFLTDKGQLERFEIRSPNYSEVVRRYAWRRVSKFRLATSIRPNSYLSHGTAVFMHGLTDLVPKTIYINKEQSPKPSNGRLSQRGIDLAFSRKQRKSRLTFNLNACASFRVDNFSLLFVLLKERCDRHSQRIGERLNRR